MGTYIRFGIVAFCCLLVAACRFSFNYDVQEEVPELAIEVTESVLQAILAKDQAAVLALTDINLMAERDLDFAGFVPTLFTLLPEDLIGAPELAHSEVRKNEDPKNEYPIYVVQYKLKSSDGYTLLTIATHDRESCCLVRHLAIKQMPNED